MSRYRSVGEPDGIFLDPVYVNSTRQMLIDHGVAPEDMAETSKLPYAIHAGPLEFSTSGVIERWPAICFDVCSYYAELGVSFRATKTELRAAYQAKKGWESERLTYILKQLLNESIRRAYDAVRAGNRFMDRYEIAWLKSQMIADARAEGLNFDPLDPGEGESINSVADRYLDTEFDFDRSEEGDSGRWKWGYYLWRTEIHDVPKLRDWQALLLQSEPPSMNLCVGLMRNHEPTPHLPAYLVQKLGYRIIVFLNVYATPDTQLAQLAIKDCAHV